MTQRVFDVSWKINTTAIIFFDTVFLNTDSSLPKGYCYKVSANKSSSGLVKYISLFHPTAIDSLTFTYSGTTLQALKYNTNIVSPSNGNAFAAKVPVVVSK
jgi:hypothetical protein